MEILDKLVDWFNAITAGIERLVTVLFGSSNERRIRAIGYKRDKAGNEIVVPGSTLDRINKFEPEFEKLTDAELKQTASRLREQLDAGKTLDDVMPEAFAAARESGRRFLKMRHYDVQMVGGYVLHHGIIAEMVTGEGKTLVATLPAFLNALTGHVHVITVNDYLALRDMEWMGPVYLGLGLTVGAIQSQMRPDERQKHYACDITYGTNNEFGFDYLRDNMKPVKELQAQGPLNFAIVDEIDNILIDEARTPLIISGPAHDDIEKYAKADRIVRQLKKGEDFEVKEKEHTCHLNEGGIRHAEELAGVESFYTAGNMEWPHLLDNGLKAHHLYKRDVNYVVENGTVVIVDEFTGRKMEGRQWSDGLHQAVEAKEGVPIKAENQTLATITLQNYFKLYKKLAGMTGTAMTEAAEFWKIYKLDVLTVPTNRPLHRVNHPDVIYLTEDEKWDAAVEEIREVNKSGRPTLVGTVSIEKSELLSRKLDKFGVKHNVLNAKHHEREAEIIAQAGRKGAVTIATNMAGRGTDIILGGNPEHMAWEELSQKYESRLEVSKAEWDEVTNGISEREGMFAEGRDVARLGGLHVLGTERHDSRRIDLQLRGRAGRQGDPGSSRFFLSLEDDLMRIFAGEWVKSILTRLGMQKGEAIESPMVSRRIAAAQKKVEERHFDQRKHLLEYDEVMDEQRKQVYAYRQRILDGENCRQLILDMAHLQIEQATAIFLDTSYRWGTIVSWAGQVCGVEVDISDIRDMNQSQLADYLKEETIRQGVDQIGEQIEENLPEDTEDTGEWNWLAMSKWANSRWGLNTNDRELKKIGRETLQTHLADRAVESANRLDFPPLDEFLADEWPRRALCGWLTQQFTLEMSPDELADLETPQEADTIIIDKIEQLYRQKEVCFPVAVAMHRFLGLERQISGERYDRDGLVRWSNDRFGTEMQITDLKGKPRSEIEKLLTEVSQSYLVNGEEDVTIKVDGYLDRAFGSANGEDAASHGRQSTNGQENEVVAELAEWAAQELQVKLELSELQTLPREKLRQRVLDEYDNRFRPELCQAERSLVLEVLDTAWKDHLHYMDHLRSGIGLVGYAQIDPKVEYKRKGRSAFKTMWDRIGEQVTSAIFRMEHESPGFVGSLWEITSTVHEEANTGSDYGPETDDDHLDPGRSRQAIEPIRNKQPKVGRNDPCPCGSGKKYKKCHGRG